MHLAAYFLRNSLLTVLVMLGWPCSCLSMVVSFHVKENREISYTKGGTMYGEWLVLHQVPHCKNTLRVVGTNNRADPKVCKKLLS